MRILLLTAYAGIPEKALKTIVILFSRVKILMDSRI